jgi:hypothetical protein
VRVLRSARRAYPFCSRHRLPGGPQRRLTHSTYSTLRAYLAILYSSNSVPDATISILVLPPIVICDPAARKPHIWRLWAVFAETGSDVASARPLLFIRALAASPTTAASASLVYCTAAYTAAVLDHNKALVIVIPSAAGSFFLPRPSPVFHDAVPGTSPAA